MYKVISTFDKDGNYNYRFIIDNEDERFYYFVNNFLGDELRFDKELEIVQYKGNDNLWITFENWLNTKEKPTFKIEVKEE